jgi:RNA polymerase sigma factor (sigma-70 family)
MTATADAGGRWRPSSLGLLGDERLARHAGSGNAQAFGIVYERYHNALYRYCRSILRNDADAQDALQSTFASAFAALRSGQRDAPMRPWLFRIAHNESISALRRRRPCFELSAASERGTASAEEEVAGRAELKLLLRDLRELTDRQRSALVLRELSGLSHEEIAIAIGTSVGGAKQMIFEARRALFEFAQGRDMACDEIRKTISDADGRSLRARRVRAHLRECTACASFAAAIPARSAQLRALTPVLPAGAAAGMLGRIAVSHIGRGGGSSIARLAAGAAGKTATIGAGFGANTLAGVAVVASATVGVTVGVDKFIHRMSQGTAIHASTRAPARSAGAGRSSSLTGPGSAARARSAERPGDTAVRAAASPSSAITLRLRSTGSTGVSPGARIGAGAAGRLRGATGGVGASAAGNAGAGQPTTRVGQTAAGTGGSAASSGRDGQRGGAAVSSAANASGRNGNATSRSDAGGGSQSAGTSSSGSGRAASSGSGQPGSGRSENGSWRSEDGAGGSGNGPGRSGNGSGRSGNGSGRSDSAGLGVNGLVPSATNSSATSGTNGSARSSDCVPAGSGPPLGVGAARTAANTPGASGALGAVPAAASSATASNRDAVAGAIVLPAPALLHGHP